jgi:hypothetical protein
MVKGFPIYERVKLTFAAEFLNAFNNPYFFVRGTDPNGVTTNFDSTTFGQTSKLANCPRNIQSGWFDNPDAPGTAPQQASGPWRVCRFSTLWVRWLVSCTLGLEESHGSDA